MRKQDIVRAASP